MHVIAGLREQVRVPPLTAGHVEYAGTDRQAHDVDEPRDLAAVLLERKERLVLEEVLLVEVRRPPRQSVLLCALAVVPFTNQKNTGSRYAPNTSSIARRIS